MNNQDWLTQFDKLSLYHHHQPTYAHHWRDIAPMTVDERQKMYLENPKCFLDISDPSHPKYPVCPLGSTTPTAQGFDAAIRRARMQGNQQIIKLAEERQKEYAFSPRRTRSSVNLKGKNMKKMENNPPLTLTHTKKLSVRKRQRIKREPKKEPKIITSSTPRSIIKKEGSIKKETRININTEKNKTKTIPNRHQFKRSSSNSSLPPPLENF